MLEKVSKAIRARMHDENDENNENNEEGFTLIELLIVVVVLGVLAAVTVFGLSGSASKSAVAACKADARTTEVAIDAYHTSSPTGVWPVALADLTAPTPNNSATPPQPTGWGAAGQPPTPPPFLRTAPGNPPHYSIGLSPATDGTTHVMVTATATGTTADFDNGSPGPPAIAGNGAICDQVK